MSKLAPLVALAALAMFVGFLDACGGEPPRRPNIMHPVDERRAFELIGRVFKEAGLSIERGRQETVSGKSLTVDEAAGGHKYGVAYLTREEQTALGDAIPKGDPNADALVVVDSDSGDRVLVLFERDYMTDDLEGEAHSATTIAAEAKLQRDARDFLLKAVRDKWP
jgi:hypothetical protein